MLFNIKLKLFFLLILILFLGNCGQKNNFREYQIKSNGGNKFGQSMLKEKSLLKKLRLNRALKDGILWDQPANWKKTISDNFRLASFLSEDFVEITLVHFPDSAGSLRANLNRWAGQVNVRFSNQEVSRYINRLTIAKNKNELPFLFVDLEEVNPVSLQQENALVGIFLFSDEVLFVKMLGGKKNIEKERPTFLKLINSIRIKKV